ncbi:MAG: hypothetical protein ACREAN_07180 [Nitrosopumilaceae archaeon]
MKLGRFKQLVWKTRRIFYRSHTVRFVNDSPTSRSFYCKELKLRFAVSGNCTASVTYPVMQPRSLFQWLSLHWKDILSAISTLLSITASLKALGIQQTPVPLVAS